MRESTHASPPEQRAEPRPADLDSGDWGVPPFESLSIRTTDFDPVPPFESPMLPGGEPFEGTSDLEALEREMSAGAFVVAQSPDMGYGTHGADESVPGAPLAFDASQTPDLPATSEAPHAGTLHAAEAPHEAETLRAAEAPRKGEALHAAGAPPAANGTRASVAPRVSVTGTSPEDSGRFATPPAPNVSEAQRIVTLRVCALGDARWTGAELLDALEAHGLGYGRYKVFHRKHSDGRTLFCAASLIEPGTFDVARMPQQEFRGLTLFAVMPGPAEPLQTIDALIGTAVDLADTLSGVVQDSNGLPLSAQGAEALRDDIGRFQASLSMT